MAKVTKRKFSFFKFIIFLFVFVCIIIAYGYFIEPKLITVHEHKITNQNITENFNGLKIVHISDLYYGKTFDEKSLKKLVTSINEQKPDIVVLTGNLIDPNIKLSNDISEKISNYLKKINTTIDKYTISGDNDIKFDEWENIIKNGGFKNLNNNYDTIYMNGYNFMVIAGANTKKDKLNINEKLNTTTNYINSFEKDGPIYKILILHEPDVIDEITDNKFDLILAGHSLGGQVKIPSVGSIINKKGSKKYHESHYKINNSHLYVSNGLGSEYHFRLFNTPSYNLYRIVNK